MRRSHTLSRGEHLFVDDLVTAEDARGRGHGRAMLEWLGRQAAAEGIPRIYLDSRATAKGFYERIGYTFLTSIPCWKETSPRLTEASVLQGLSSDRASRSLAETASSSRAA